MSPERLLAFVKYTKLRHRADFEQSIKKTQHVGPISITANCLPLYERKQKPLFHHLQAPIICLLISSHVLST